jgi:protein ImuB
MRIACVHVPQFALQCATRVDPSLRGEPVAVVGLGLDPEGRRAGLHGPMVLACSRAAWALGVRVGMTGTVARGLSAELRIVTADEQLERDSARAIADTLLGVSGVVDLGGRVGPGATHLAMYCEVPARTRGASFGDRVLDCLDQLGVTGRVGIADDRFTAWVAASHAGDVRTDDIGVVVVPRGGSAAFLAPRPLSLLAISPEVQHMLEALGVRTLGEFAALPAPSVARPLEADYQGLARGDSGHMLRPYAPDGPVRELAAITASALSAPAAIAMLASRIALRIAGRGRGAARLDVTLGGEAGERVVSIVPAVAEADGSHRGRVLESAEELAEALAGALGDLGAVWRLRVVVTGEALAGELAAGRDAVAADAEAPIAAQGAELDALIAPSGPWQLTSPMLRAERRDAHRRTQHGKRRGRQGRAGSPAKEALVQPRLFKTPV